MNPDDVMLRKKTPTSATPSVSTSILDQALVQEPISWIDKLLNWWDSLKIKPHAEIHLDKSDPEHRPGVMIGIKGTF